MANKAVFGQKSSVPTADTVNLAGGKAYSMTAKHALAQLAVTGCFNDTFYASAQTQVDKVLELCKQVDTLFVAQCALYCRWRGYMKDMPALLIAHLATRGDSVLFQDTFLQVIDSPKMLRNFTQIMRSGVVGRKSFGSMTERCVRMWFGLRTDEHIFRGSIGNSPTLAQVIRLAHVPSRSEGRKALFARLLDREYAVNQLPELVKQYDAFKTAPAGKSIPDVPMEMLTQLPLSREQWIEVMKKASWHTLRMNLNTFQRHGVFDYPKEVEYAAAKLANPEEVRRAKAFPYQLLVAYKNTDGVDAKLQNALQDAMEVAVDNVPILTDKRIWVFPDVSGSMRSPITGTRAGSTTKVHCVDVAALMAASIVRRNSSNAQVLPFEQSVVAMRLNPRDSIMTNARMLGSVGGGGTNCAAPLETLNARNENADLLIYVSDNESWINSQGFGGRGTATMEAWRKFKGRNPRAKMVCIDLTPNTTTQAPDDKSILNVGGFSDNVFKVIDVFVKGETGDTNHWVSVIEQFAKSVQSAPTVEGSSTEESRSED